MRVNEDGYLERRSAGRGSSRRIKEPKKKSRQDPIKYRDWWLVKSASQRMGHISVKPNIYLPVKWVGKKVRFKIELYTPGVRRK